MDEKKQREVAGRDNFGDDGGTRVGRPDAGRPDERSARLSENATKEGIEGAILDEAGDRGERRADGSSMIDSGNVHQPKGDRQQMGAEAEKGIRDAQRARGGEQEGERRPGSEPLEDRERTHKPGYGGENGNPRTSADERENFDDLRKR